MYVPTRKCPSFRISGRLNIHKLIPLGLARRANGLLRWAFWVQDPAHRKLVETIARETSPTFLKWAINEVVNWKGTEAKNVFQLHGDKDRTFPLSNIKHPDVVLKGTGHFMVVQRADEIAKIIEKLVGKLP